MPKPQKTYSVVGTATFSEVRAVQTIRSSGYLRSTFRRPLTVMRLSGSSVVRKARTGVCPPLSRRARMRSE